MKSLGVAIGVVLSVVYFAAAMVIDYYRHKGDMLTAALFIFMVFLGAYWAFTAWEIATGRRVYRYSKDGE